MPWRGPNYPGELPTLGWYVLRWMAQKLVVPDDRFAGEPFILTPEQAQFVLDFYAVDPVTGRRRIRRAIWSRSKGHGKSPLVAGLCIVEALADVYPDGWDSDGEPVGRPWATLGFKPKVQLLGVSEDQTQNAWDPLLDMVRNGPLAHEPGVTAMDTFVVVPRGRIEPVTSSASSREGFRPVFAAMDQTESWTASNGGVKLAAAVRRNLSKTGGSSIETPNSYNPGGGSVSEASFVAAQKLAEGKLKSSSGILLDHREAPGETDMFDKTSLLAGLRWAYGCSADTPCALTAAGLHPEHDRGWVDLDRKVAEVWDPDTDPADSRMYYLNQVTAAANSWLSQPEWAACGPKRGDEPRVITKTEPITLGFDGSRSRTRGKTDATALVGCTVKDGHVFLIRAWEHPDNVDEWQVPTIEVEATVKETLDTYNVVGFYADPAKWESYVADWEARYGKRLKVGRAGHPIEWWMTGGRSGMIAKALEQFHTAIVEGEMTHDGSSILTRHMLNARRKIRNGTLQIGKRHPDSEDKIDAAVAATLAWQARVDAIAKGIGTTTTRRAPRRLI